MGLRVLEVLRAVAQGGDGSHARDGTGPTRSGTYDRMKSALFQLYVRALGRWPLNGATRIYDADWDVLVVLDACRADLMEEVADEYAFLEDRETVRSVGSHTIEWLGKTFSPRYRTEMGDTAYVTANPQSTRVLDRDAFQVMDEVWRYGWDGDAGTVHPRTLTARGVEVWKRHRPERMILHYMQPHYPFLPEALGPGIELDGDGPLPGESVWTRLRRREVDLESVWNAYRDNLRLVLDHVETLLDGIDADRVVITSDHGNAMGEYGIFGHPAHIPLASLRTVPWVRTSAKDRGEAEVRSEGSPDGGTVEDRLQALGYG